MQAFKYTLICTNISLNVFKVYSDKRSFVWNFDKNIKTSNIYSPYNEYFYIIKILKYDPYLISSSKKQIKVLKVFIFYLVTN